MRTTVGSGMHIVRHTIPTGAVNHADPLVVLVTAHLHLESVLIGFILDRLAKPAALKVDRLSFPTKVDLGIALGGLPEHSRPALLSINAIRNRFAHSLEADISAEDVSNLLRDTQYLKDIVVDPEWDELPPRTQVGLIAMTLQAYLFGALDALRNPQLMLHGDEALAARAAELYPLPVSSTDPTSDALGA
jgi:hypothetical protein